MSRVGAYEAKTHFPRLLERVARGERITITRHGVPVAILIPAGADTTLETSEAIRELRRLRLGKRLGGLPLRDLIDEGRS
jgi:prevent-host-death family protein